MTSQVIPTEKNVKSDPILEVYNGGSQACEWSESYNHQCTNANHAKAPMSTTQKHQCQLRIIKMEEKLLEETIEELKNKIQSLEAENEKVRDALIKHGILTP